MTRAFLVVMDSVGIGGAPDAHAFFNGTTPDTGANTFAHIAQACAEGRANAGREGPLAVPVLASLGLAQAVSLASGSRCPGLAPGPLQGKWGAATERSIGKDTPSGHWELAGLPVPFDWHYFPDSQPAFPDHVTAKACEIAGTDGILGNCHGSGTVMIDQFGAEHLKTGWPICYTSADSVFQIAAHEEAFGLDRLLELCERLAPYLHEMKVGRVIARPFVGEVGNFTRTKNRRDFAITPPAPVLTNWVQDAGRRVLAVGKIGDIFSMQGIDEVRLSGGGVSSAMPHKQNPVLAETLVAFARYNATQSGGLAQVLVHEQERSGAAWTLEWMILPPMLETTMKGLSLAARMLGQVESVGKPAG